MARRKLCKYPPRYKYTNTDIQLLAHACHSRVNCLHESGKVVHTFILGDISNGLNDDCDQRYKQEQSTAHVVMDPVLESGLKHQVASLFELLDDLLSDSFNLHLIVEMWLAIRDS